MPEPSEAPAPPPWSLSRRLTAWYAASAFALIVLVTCFLYWDLLAGLDSEDDRLLADKVRELRSVLQEQAGSTSKLQQEVTRESTTGGESQIYIRVLDEATHAVFETPGMTGELAATVFARPYGVGVDPRPGSNVRSRSGVPYRSVAARAAVGDSKNGTWVIQAAVARLDDDALLKRHRWVHWPVLAAAFVACVAAGHAIARRGIRHVEEVAATARRIRSSTLDERIDTSRLPVELRTLGETFNEMLHRLEETFARLSRFSADIAHELRTPIQNLQGAAEVALRRSRSPEGYRAALESNVEECHRLARMIDRLLFLARAESPSAQIDREPVDLQQELMVVRDFFEPSAAEAGLALRVSCPPALAAELDRALFQRAVGNLVANALSNTASGGHVTIEAGSEGDRVRVQVSDTGRGIPPEHLLHVFDRFYRVDRSRSAASGGVGLGLAIVQSIVDLHGGTVGIESTLGRGTRVTLLIPRRPRATLPEMTVS